MDAKPDVKLRYTMPLLFQRGTACRWLKGGLVAVLGCGVLLAGCQSRTVSDAPGPATAPETSSVEQTPDPADPATPPSDAAADTPAPTETAAPLETVTQAQPNTAAVQAGPALPNALTRQWEPASNVLFTFGPMTITPDQVQWGSGQSSPYTVISTDGGYLLQLESNPTFYETANPYIKLIPDTDEAGGTTSIDVAFYESSAKAQSDEYIMYGSYFVE